MLPWLSFAQPKAIVLRGVVKDQNLDIPLSKARIYISETGVYASSDSVGLFKITLPKAGEYHLFISHLGCKSQRILTSIFSDSFVTLYMEHYHKHLSEVHIKNRVSGIVETISKKEIDENANQNLSTILESAAGVQSLKNGSGIAKPIIQGIYGNRLTILNQGIAQSGQQWGNDHAPEIDPFTANKIRIIKTVSALEYKGVQMGAIVSVESNKIQKEKHLHGRFNTFYETNGRGYGFNALLENGNSFLSWRATATHKKNGDKFTPDYFLRNTGREEFNGSLQLEKNLFKSWKSTAFLSSFNSDIGILRGSHISNLTDLQAAFQKEIPFFTENDFSNSIDPPRQRVNHQFWKMNSVKELDSFRTIELIYSGQINNRREFDIRRGGRSEIPALHIIQYSNYLEMKYSKIDVNEKTKLGMQMNYIENINQPETGITPVIPNYSSVEPSAFFIKTFLYDHSELDLGLRYDFFYQNIFTTTQDLPKVNVQYNHSFHNISTSLSYQHHISSHTDLKFNSGFTLRNPGINELYSFGLHQGISSIEEGNRNLNAEKSFKTSIAITSDIKERIFLEANAYFHNINDFIYLKPQNELRITIRGAFPVFKYEQTHAQIYGLDLSTTIDLHESIKNKTTFSYIQGWNLSEDIPMIFIPVNTLDNTLEFNLGKLSGFENVALEINGKYFFKQVNLNSNQDFIPAPEGYMILGGKLSAEKSIKKIRANVYIKATNALNVRYRDYLNRLRYFADELGVNIVLGTSISF